MSYYQLNNVGRVVVPTEEQKSYMYDGDLYLYNGANLIFIGKTSKEPRKDSFIRRIMSTVQKLVKWIR